jgi:magnesium chelatase family protein
MIQCYVSKVYGPLLDLIDIHIEVPAVQYEEPRGGASAEIRTASSGPLASARRFSEAIAYWTMYVLTE